MWGCFFKVGDKVKWISVFPTHVGVFLHSSPHHQDAGRLPHACGGVSLSSLPFLAYLLSSPRMWGCFYRKPSQTPSGQVFPTHVGVFLLSCNCERLVLCLPHACGGVSLAKRISAMFTGSSPRMWGCFLQDVQVFWRYRVFPTHVGVFPLRGFMDYLGICLPHACGGVSDKRLNSMGFIRSSPRMWGCFWAKIKKAILVFVFPTHVGVFLHRDISLPAYLCLPHACGGVSSKSTARVNAFWSSPRMWGCFLSSVRIVVADIVFPTHVGVFPAVDIVILLMRRLPHACGGVSSAGKAGFLTRWSSPRMWGCFLETANVNFYGKVFPTHVGVFPAVVDIVVLLSRSSPRMWGCF